jgi:predicted GTPase
MRIERTSDEIVIRLPSYIKTDTIERILDFLAYTEATSRSQATQEEIDKLAKEVKKGWWKNNKDRFLK